MDIRIESLLFRWPHSGFELSVPSLHLEARVSAAIIGPSGSGKTTFLKLLAGIEQAEKGVIQFGATTITRLNGNQRRAFRQSSIGYVFQDFKLIEYLNVQDNILTPWRLSETSEYSKTKMEARASELMGRLGLASLKHRPIGQLSQGERQRTAIARALLLKPGLVIADEPTGNLDPGNKTVVRDLLLSEIAQQGSILVMVTHDRSLVEGFDRVIDFEDFQSKTSQKATAQ